MEFQRKRMTKQIFFFLKILGCMAVWFGFLGTLRCFFSYVSLFTGCTGGFQWSEEYNFCTLIGNMGIGMKSFVIMCLSNCATFSRIVGKSPCATIISIFLSFQNSETFFILFLLFGESFVIPESFFYTNDCYVILWGMNSTLVWSFLILSITQHVTQVFLNF